MNDAAGNLRDSSGAAVRPPIAWAIAGLALGWLGGIVFLAGLALLIWTAASENC